MARRAFLLGPRFGFSHLKETGECEACRTRRGLHTCLTGPAAAAPENPADVGWMRVVASSHAAALPWSVSWREQRMFDAIARLIGGPLAVRCGELSDGENPPGKWVGFTVAIASDCPPMYHVEPCGCVGIIHDGACFGPGSGPHRSLDESIARLYSRFELWRGGSIVRARPGQVVKFGPLDAERKACVEVVEQIPDSWNWNYHRISR